MDKLVCDSGPAANGHKPLGAEGLPEIKNLISGFWWNGLTRKHASRDPGQLAEVTTKGGQPARVFCEKAHVRQDILSITCATASP